MKKKINVTKFSAIYVFIYKIKYRVTVTVNIYNKKDCISRNLYGVLYKNKHALNILPTSVGS